MVLAAMDSWAYIPKRELGSEGSERRIWSLGLKYPFWDLSHAMSAAECFSSASVTSPSFSTACALTVVMVVLVLWMARIAVVNGKTTRGNHMIKDMDVQCIWYYCQFNGID